MPYPMSFAMILGSLVGVVPWYSGLVAIIVEYAFSTYNDHLARQADLEKHKQETNTRAIGFNINGDQAENED